tara:strand:+ start:267 stop:380 length:114 start_codon:yes stop_codon:yes gene_type:complete
MMVDYLDYDTACGTRSTTAGGHADIHQIPSRIERLIV